MKNAKPRPTVQSEIQSAADRFGDITILAPIALTLARRGELQHR